MKRVMRAGIAAGFMIAIGLIAVSSGASAGIWAWGCQGQLGDEQVIFNRYSMIVAATKQKMDDVRNMTANKIELPSTIDHTSYDPQNINDGFSESIEFLRHDDDKHKIVLTEKSSRRMSHKHKLICGRDEDLDIYRKVYSFRRDDEPARDIVMQCMEYQLSTRGGRPCN